MPTEKFYKAFVSSTYRDLIDERDAVYQALLKTNCFPVGMEHFPGTDRGRNLELIKDYIGRCDYFLVISAGMYGSRLKGRVQSFTEWEYDTAVELEIPIFSFLHQNRGQIQSDKCEKDDDGKSRLKNFRDKIEKANGICKYYSTPAELTGEVLHTMQNAPSISPRVGWIKGDTQFEPSSGSLVGMWELVQSDTRAWQKSRILKVFSEEEFLWIELDLATGRLKNFIAGVYRLDGYETEIAETARESSVRSMIGQQQQYEIEIDDDTMKTVGSRSTSATMTEEFRRVEWDGCQFVY